jgi:hypothetical protein
MAATPAAPLAELGYPTGGKGSWWSDTDEPAPELRWPLSIDVYDRMRKQDAQVASVLRAVSLPVRRTAWMIEPNGATDEVTQHVADDLGLPIHGGDNNRTARRVRDRFSWADHLRLALTMLPFGHSFFEQLYRPDDPSNPTRFHLRKLGWRSPRTISNFRVASDGGLDAIEQFPAKAGQPTVVIPVSRLVAYVHDREGGNWAGNSLLRPGYKHWLLKDRLIRVQAQTIDRNGMGIPVYEGAENETDLSAGLTMARQYRSGESAGAAVPYGAKLRLLGVEGALPDAQPAIQYHDEQIARAVLAHVLNLGTQTGSWALGSTLEEIFSQSLQTIAQQIADVATQHIVEDIVDVNWGEDEPAPKIVFEEIGSRQVATAQAIKLLTDAGILLPDRSLEEAARQQYGLPPKDARGYPRPAAPASPSPDPTAPDSTAEPASTTNRPDSVANLLPVLEATRQEGETRGV